MDTSPQGSGFAPTTVSSSLAVYKLFRVRALDLNNAGVQRAVYVAPAFIVPLKIKAGQQQMRL